MASKISPSIEYSGVPSIHGAPIPIADAGGVMMVPMAQPMGQPMMQPMMQPMVQPMVQDIGQPMAQPMVQPMVQPLTQPIQSGNLSNYGRHISLQTHNPGVVQLV